jgi:two-component system response regulator NreC
MRIELIEDQSLVRAGIRVLIDYQPDMRVVAEAPNAIDGIRMARETIPDVILLDVAMPGCSGLDAIVPLLEAAPKSRILMLTAHDSQANLRLALARGAGGFLAKNTSPNELAMAIRSLYGGRSYVSVQLAGSQALKAVTKSRSNIGTSLQDLLSERELEVLTLVAAGNTNNEVAEKLMVSLKSIETYRRRLMKKLGFAKRSDLVRFALESGLIAAGHHE